MIQKTHRNDNDVYNEMLTVLASDEHKQKFAQDVELSGEIKGSSLKDKILDKLETTLKSKPNDVVLNRVINALYGTPSNVSDADLKMVVQDVKSDMDVAEELTPEEITELGKLTGVPNFKADVTVPHKYESPFAEYAEKPVNPMEAEMYKNPTEQLEMSKPIKELELPVSQSTADLINDITKIANYLGKTNLIKSEFIADMLIASIIDES